MTSSKKPPSPRRSRRKLPKVDTEGAPSTLEDVRREPPPSDAAMALLRAELERAVADLQVEREARAADARAHESLEERCKRAEERARLAEQAMESALASTETHKRAASELEDSVARLWRELGVARREIDSRTDQLRKAESAASEKVQTYDRRIAELEERLRATKLPKTKPDMPAARQSAPPLEGADEVTVLKAKLEEAHAEARRMRENFEMLQTRAGRIGAGLREMRELMVQSAALFDDLEERERAIGEIRAKSLRDARALFLRAAGKNDEVGRPPPPPVPKPPIEDLSEAAELLEEELRRSTHPPPPDDEASTPAARPEVKEPVRD